MQEDERFDWVHPSWRDVIIEHLMRRPTERRRFLQRCGVAGLELALSISGGRSGERELPLLQTDYDWLTFSRRSIQLIHDMTLSEHQGLMAATRSLLQSTQSGTNREGQAIALTREMLPAIVAEWDSRASILPTSALQQFYAISELVLPLCPGPQLAHTLYRQLGPLKGLPDVVSDAEDWEVLDLALVVERNEPRALRQIGWPQEYREYLELLASHAKNVLARARRLTRAIDRKKTITVDAAQQLSYETFSQHRIVSLLRQLDRRVDRNGYLVRGLSGVEWEIDVWLEDYEEKAREERVQQNKDDQGDKTDEDAIPAPFSIPEMFSDL